MVSTKSPSLSATLLRTVISCQSPTMTFVFCYGVLESWISQFSFQSYRTCESLSSLLIQLFDYSFRGKERVGKRSMDTEQMHLIRRGTQHYSCPVGLIYGKMGLSGEVSLLSSLFRLSLWGTIPSQTQRTSDKWVICYEKKSVGK